MRVYGFVFGLCFCISFVLLFSVCAFVLCVLWFVYVLFVLLRLFCIVCLFVSFVGWVVVVVLFFGRLLFGNVCLSRCLFCVVLPFVDLLECFLFVGSFIFLVDCCCSLFCFFSFCFFACLFACSFVWVRGVSLHVWFVAFDV